MGDVWAMCGRCVGDVWAMSWGAQTAILSPISDYACRCALCWEALTVIMSSNSKFGVSENLLALAKACGIYNLKASEIVLKSCFRK